MKKTTLIWSAVAALALSLSVSAQEGPRGDRGGPGSHGNRGNAPVITGLVRAIHRNLEISEEQETGIRAIMEQFRTDMKPLFKQQHESRKSLEALVNAEEYDPAAVEAFANEQGDLTAQRIIIGADAVAAVLATLTDEQRAELQALKEEHQARRGNHNKKRGDRRKGDG